MLDPILGYSILAKKAYFDPLKYSRPFNFGPNNKQFFSVMQLVKIVQGLNLLPLKIQIVDNPINEKTYLALDSTAAVSLINWSNEGNIETDLKFTIQGYQLLSEPELFVKSCKELINGKIE